MKWPWLYAAWLWSVLPSNAGAWGQKASLSAGSLHIEVIDTEGNLTSEAPVYIFGAGAPQLTDLRGGDTVPLPEGIYDIVSARVLRSENGFTREMSAVGRVMITDGDQTSVVLPLAVIPAFAPILDKRKLPNF